MVKKTDLCNILSPTDRENIAEASVNKFKETINNALAPYNSQYSQSSKDSNDKIRRIDSVKRTILNAIIELAEGIERSVYERARIEHIHENEMIALLVESFNILLIILGIK